MVTAQSFHVFFFWLEAWEHPAGHSIVLTALIHIDSTLVVCHHLVYLYGVHNVYIQFMSIKSLRLNICKSLPCLVLLPGRHV